MKPVKPITVNELGRILYEEFERDLWGDVDPDAFKNPRRTSESKNDEMAGLYEVLERAANRINKRLALKCPAKK